MNVQDKIVKLEKELAALKEQCGNYKPQDGSYCISGGGNICNPFTEEIKYYVTSGRAYDTKEKAEKARDIMIKHDIILKYVIDHAPDWEPESIYDIWSVWNSPDDGKWVTVMQDLAPDIGTILMPEWVAEKLADDLNNNRINLEPHKK